MTWLHVHEVCCLSDSLEKGILLQVFCTFNRTHDAWYDVAIKLLVELLHMDLYLRLEVLKDDLYGSAL